MSLVMTEIADTLVSEASDKAEAVIESRELRVIFSRKWVRMMYVVLSAVVQSRDMKALVKWYDHNADGRAAYIHVLHVSETEFYGLLTCVKCINLRICNE